MVNQSNKEALRAELKKIRTEISLVRREQAAQSLLDSLLPFLASYKAVLSFASLSSEIDTSLLNRFLASTGRLLLPKTEGGILKVFRVSDLDNQLEKGAFGLSEPASSKCQEIPGSEIEIALVPALGFDRSNNRIGYGKGYYDRFLHALSCSTIGIGFKEQLVDAVPVDPNDVPLSRVSLF